MIRYFENKKQGHSWMVAHDTILMLSQSQGFYSRMREHMEKTNWEPLDELCRTHEFNDALDFILFVEQ